MQQHLLQTEEAIVCFLRSSLVGSSEASRGGPSALRRPGPGPTPRRGTSPVSTSGVAAGRTTPADMSLTVETLERVTGIEPA